MTQHGREEDLDGEGLARLGRHFDESIPFSRLVGVKVENVDSGRAACYVDVGETHLNGNGSLHGGVYTSLVDNAMGLAVVSLVDTRTATVGLNVHFLGAVSEGRIVCSAEVVHRTRRLATLEAKVHDGGGNLVALATGTFRIFEKHGDPVV